MKKLFLMVSLGLLMCACGSKTKTADAVTADSSSLTDMHNAENALDYLGTYEGTTPAADCPGILTTLTLLADGTYTLHLSYLEREAEFDERGTYKVAGNILIATDKEGRNHYYQVREGAVAMLDADQQPINGELAEKYVLKQKN